MRISDWSSDVCSSDLMDLAFLQLRYGDYQRARANAERAYANNRHCPKILSRAGTVLFFLGDKRGLDLVNRALETESDPARSEEGRVGKEGVSTVRYRW